MFAGVLFRWMGRWTYFMFSVHFLHRIKPSVIFNFSQFLTERIYEQFLKIQTKGMFKYVFIIVYIFVFYLANKFPFAVQKLNE